MPPARVRVRERREGERTEYNRIAASNPRFPNRRVGRHNQKVSLEGEDPVAKGARSAMVFGQVQTSPCPDSQSTENNAKSRLAKPFFFFFFLRSNLVASKRRGGNITEPLCKGKVKRIVLFKMVSLL